ncbi:unnamed protein product [Heligmosomoides polygyrus]|uniref:TNFR-Cys domain-containing protein n=1 Tax=Heligmosomoides polygyrus TaxID=6339 RepID=A0A183FFZ1_HELPZ|nr:unnamed protein product [Heligmosomoides polygyrus]
MLPVMAITVCLLVLFPTAIAVTVSLSRPDPGAPRYFYEARSLIVCRTECDATCYAASSSLWNGRTFRCNQCMQHCIRRENMVYEDGPQDLGLIRSVDVCCARLVTYLRISARILFDVDGDLNIEKSLFVLEYRTISDVDDLHEPAWSLSQIIRGRSVIVSDLQCGYLYQFRVTLVSTKIVDRRTSSWISNRHLCNRQ